MLEKYEDIPKVDKMRAITDYINRAGAVSMSDLQRKKLYKLSVRQCTVMANIRRYTQIHPEGIPMSILAERVGMSPSAASHMVDSLMSQSMVERHQSPTDRRAVLVTISQAFLTLASSIEKAQQKAIEELSIDLTEEERHINNLVLDKLYAAVMERDGL